MFESKYSKALTIVLVVVILVIVILLGCLSYDYIKKYNTSKQASDFVENYEGNITTSNDNSSNENIIQENVTLDSTNETPISSSTSGTT